MLCCTASCRSSESSPPARGLRYRNRPSYIKAAPTVLHAMEGAAQTEPGCPGHPVGSPVPVAELGQTPPAMTAAARVYSTRAAAWQSWAPEPGMSSLLAPWQRRPPPRRDPPPQRLRSLAEACGQEQCWLTAPRPSCHCLPPRPRRPLLSVPAPRHRHCGRQTQHHLPRQLLRLSGVRTSTSPQQATIRLEGPTNGSE